ncbi:hypothetical protein [Streptomyces sp. NPDC056707]|uniref:hypothetical protein n=1 Tax=Streptomyces sp. NPDC056707 TaxID=3345919 RepID=UPI0036A7FD25
MLDEAFDHSAAQDTYANYLPVPALRRPVCCISPGAAFEAYRETSVSAEIWRPSLDDRLIDHALDWRARSFGLRNT